MMLETQNDDTPDMKFELLFFIKRFFNKYNVNNLFPEAIVQLVKKKIFE